MQSAEYLNENVVQIYFACKVKLPVHAVGVRPNHMEDMLTLVFSEFAL